MVLFDVSVSGNHYRLFWIRRKGVMEPEVGSKNKSATAEADIFSGILLNRPVANGRTKHNIVLKISCIQMQSVMCKWVCNSTGRSSRFQDLPLLIKMV